MTVSIGSEMYANIKEGSWFTQFGNGCNPWMARYVYGSFFLIANLLAWAVRDYGYTTFKSMQKLKNCNVGRECLDTLGVLRVSFGCFMFYIIMFVSTTGTSKMNGRREKWHSGWWIPKTMMMLALIVLSFFLPSKLFSIYGEIALYGAGVFLLIQLISMITFINWVNKKCYCENSRISSLQRRVLATFTHFLCVLAIAFLYGWYAPHMSCTLNISIISGTLGLYITMVVVSHFLTVNAGSLSSSLMGLYVIFLSWCALKSEPEENCMRKGGSDHTSKIDVLTIILKREDEKHEDDVPYGYGFFHLVFATGSMYSAMLFVGWNTNHSMQKFTIDIGWTSAYVRIVNEILALFVYGKFCYVSFTMY
ncbi:hypothetical protein DM860_005421 [Cuscuta australis]|uniref:Serine incorporator n=1 Tax=Cuscuta australis TaxID=267555 RepID=A0A328DZA4_9ASTE|nr:hypothetical protein DM860_005421 [Cuscuta australis]